MTRTLLPFLLMSLFAVFNSAFAVTLENVRSNRLPDKVQVVLDISAATQFEQFSLADPPRIVLDFPNSKRSGRAGLKVGQGAVRTVRTGYKESNRVRVVIDLNYPAKANIYPVKPGGGRGNRIVIDVYDQNIAPALTLESLQGVSQSPYVIFAGEPLPNASHIRPVIKPEDNTNLLTVERAVSATGQVKVQKMMPAPQAVVPKRDIIVAIDPGHGGKDPGAYSKATGLREKDAVLQIGLRLKQQIDAKRGFRAVMTRDSDIYIPLRQRMQIARRYGADLFVSIHADAVESSVPKGSSVYILSTRGASSQLAKYLANKENAVDLKWGVDVSKYDNEIQQALLNIQQEATLESSDVLARQTLKELARIGNVHKANVERANFVVLRSPEIPSMLVETAFISNPDEARLLASPTYQLKLAQGIANGIERYFEEHLPQHMLLGVK